MDLLIYLIIFIVMMIVVCGILIFLMKRAFISDTEGALKRLEDETGKANAMQLDLQNKLKEADNELERKRTEAKELANKMKSDVEHESKEEREKIIREARQEGEAIITKAQGATEKLRLELEKEMDARGVDFGMQLLNKVLNEKAQGTLDKILIAEFLNKLKTMDMSRISSGIKEVEVMTLTDLDETTKSQLSQVLKEKMGRDMAIKCTRDASLGGGMVLKFGSMALDGSIRNLLREEGTKMKEEIEARIA